MDPFFLSVSQVGWIIAGVASVHPATTTPRGPHLYSWMQQAAYTVTLSMEGDRRGKGGEN